VWFEQPMPVNKPKRKRKRAGSTREAVKEVIRNDEYARMREAYERQPDSPDEADDWSSAEEFRTF